MDGQNARLSLFVMFVFYEAYVDVKLEEDRNAVQ